jgi:asparagine synthase (glutamine-hydrolysing)
MCGIFALISAQNIAGNTKVRKYALRMSAKLRHRGPDGTGYIQTEHGCFAHERLSIIDPDGGNQPLVNKDKTVILCVNGEIFNYKKLRIEYPHYPYRTGSDCESILALYDHYYNETADTELTHLQIVQILGQLDGQFSFVLHDICST